MWPLFTGLCNRLKNCNNSNCRRYNTENRRAPGGDLVINVHARLVLTILALGTGAFLGGCAEMEPKPFEPSEGHIQSETTAAEADEGTIPDVVTQAPVLPEPEPAKPLEKYTVVVNEVPVKELLFALARDADLNVDLYPGIEGTVTLNAVDQTLPQILDRISRQIDIRYEFKNDNVIVTPDAPYFKNYRVDYVNMARDTVTTNRLTTQISTTGSTDVGGAAGGGGGGNTNNSTTDIESVSNNRFWQRLVSNIAAVIGDQADQQSGGNREVTGTDNVIPSPESGVVSVRATSKQHELIRKHIDQVIDNAQRQVLVQATIVEVTLSDQYQAGINWSALDIADSSISIITNTLGLPAESPPLPSPLEGSDSINSFLQLRYDGSDFTSLIRFLEEFGDTNVLSSPQAMVLNNQTAILKVVENVVYFEIESEISQGSLGAQPVISADSEARTVPVGIVMSLTPQISDSGEITLNVRPTVSRISQFVPDPAVQLIQSSQFGGGGDVEIPPNLVPQIEVRELESMLRLTSGQTAVLGGLMQNEEFDGRNAIPGVSRIPIIGKAFETKTKQYRKQELVIFLRPVVINNPGVNADLRDYRTFLPQADRSAGDSLQ